MWRYCNGKIFWRVGKTVFCLGVESSRYQLCLCLPPILLRLSRRVFFIDSSWFFYIWRNPGVSWHYNTRLGVTDITHSLSVTFWHWHKIWAKHNDIDFTLCTFYTLFGPVVTVTFAGLRWSYELPISLWWPSSVHTLPIQYTDFSVHEAWPKTALLIYTVSHQLWLQLVYLYISSADLLIANHFTTSIRSNLSCQGLHWVNYGSKWANDGFITEKLW